MVLESKESEIYRVIKAGKALSEHQTSTAKSTTNSFPSATSTFLNIWIGYLNIFSLGDSTTSLGSLFQFLATLPVKKFSPVSNLTPLARPKAVSRKHKSCLAFPSHVCSSACSWNSCLGNTGIHPRQQKWCKTRHVVLGWAPVPLTGWVST